MMQSLQLVHAQAGLLPGFTLHGAEQGIGGRDHAAHQGVQFSRMSGLSQRALLHPHAAIGREADQMHGARGDGQWSHGAALYTGHTQALRIVHGQLLIAPWAAQAMLAH